MNSNVHTWFKHLDEAPRAVAAIVSPDTHAICQRVAADLQQDSIITYVDNLEQIITDGVKVCLDSFGEVSIDAEVCATICDVWSDVFLVVSREVSPISTVARL